MGTVVISALLVLMVAGIVRHLLRQRRQGKSPCGCGGGCSGCCGCDSQNRPPD